MKRGSALIVVLAVVALIAVGTGILENFWPAESDSVAVRAYLGEDVTKSTFPITTLGTLKKKKQAIRIKYIVSNLDLQAALNKNDAVYEFAIGEITPRVIAAKKSYDTYVGTYDKPGLALAGLLALLTGAGVKLYDKNTMYNENEVEVIKNGK